MKEKNNKNVKVENFSNMLGIAVRLIVIDPLLCSATVLSDIYQRYVCFQMQGYRW